MFGDWPLLDRVKLRECELRLRNADALRTTVAERIKEFGVKHVVQSWTDLRPMATEIQVEAETLVAEYRAIITDADEVFIPMSQHEGEMRRRAVEQHAEAALELVAPIVTAIASVIAGEDARLTSSRPSSTSE